MNMNHQLARQIVLGFKMAIDQTLADPGGGSDRFGRHPLDRTGNEQFQRRPLDSRLGRTRFRNQRVGDKLGLARMCVSNHSRIIVRPGEN